MLSDDRRLFGTDGIRGVANSELTPEFALALGRATGSLLRDGPVVIGRDTRRSGEMLSAAFQSGLNAAGVDTLDAGVLPSGAIGMVTGWSAAIMGAVISASHNPAADNGIKLLSGTGRKLSDENEDEIERRLRQGVTAAVPVGDLVGTRLAMPNAAEEYLEHLIESMNYRLRGVQMAIDCANGAAYRVAPELFKRLGAEVEVFCAEPDGTNINKGCGATEPGYLAGKAGGRLGLCFDGDADRLIAIDEDGVPANGDVILAVIARHWKAQGRLKKNKVVTTVMANLGFRRSMDAAGIEVIETPVGDRYVNEALMEHNAILGGEQSGHVIFPTFAPTGDGALTALRLLEVVAGTGKELRELRAEAITEYPQILRNVRVSDSSRLSESEPIAEAIATAEALLDGDGRILVRASGTESLIRVMAEAATREAALAAVEQITAIVRSELS